MTVREFLKLTAYSYKTDKYEIPLIRPRVVCKDNFSVSIQASYAHYCTPRKNIQLTDSDEYLTVELGYPSKDDDLIKEYAEYAENPETYDTVYGYVPVNIVEKLIKKHGGIIGINVRNLDTLSATAVGFKYAAMILNVLSHL